MRSLPHFGGVVGAVLAVTLAVAAAGCGGGGKSKPTTGAGIYKAYCSTCHGVAGQGGVGPALAGVVAEKYPNIDDQIAVVTNGKSTMPAWRGRLTSAEIRKVVVYERTKLGQ
jgi:mono/diheme cytochrome c family protein